MHGRDDHRPTTMAATTVPASSGKPVPRYRADGRTRRAGRVDFDGVEAVRLQRRRRVAAAVLVAWLTVVTIVGIVMMVQQFQQTGVWARVVTESCHAPDSGGGGAAWVSFKDDTCVVHLRYRTPSGRAGAVTFHGVDGNRLHHDTEGHQIVKIYFSSGSDTAVNPEDRPPWYFWPILFGVILLIGGATVRWLLYGSSRVKVINRRAAEEKARRTTKLAPGTHSAVVGKPKGGHAQWAADPTGRHQYRYWNGSRWTQYVADDGVQDVDPWVRP